jgi:hypothetical protein
MSDVSDAAGGPPRLPPLPPSPLPDDLVARCRAAFIASTTRDERVEVEVHRTHLRIVTPAVRDVTAYARRMHSDDLVVSFEQIVSVRPVGIMTAIIELPHRAAIALTGPAVRATLAHAGSAVSFEPRRFRPLFVGFWIVNHRGGRVYDSRRLP